MNLVDWTVEVYTDPTGPAPKSDYRGQAVYSYGDTVPLTLDGRLVAQIAVSELLPPRTPM